MIRRLVLSLAILGTAALAQSSDQSSTGSSPSAPTTRRTTTETEVGSEAAKVPDRDKLKISTDGLASMRAALKDVLDKLEEARTAKDVVKLTCVNEKLTQIKGLLRISETADVSLQEAVANKTGQTALEFTKVSIATNKVQQLRAEAEQCMGQLAFRIDENLNIEVEQPEYLPTYFRDLMSGTLLLVDLRPISASPTTAP